MPLNFFLAGAFFCSMNFPVHLIALGPGAFAHRLAAKLGALPNGALPGIITSGFVGSHDESLSFTLFLKSTWSLEQLVPIRRETNVCFLTSVKRWPLPRCLSEQAAWCSRAIFLILGGHWFDSVPRDTLSLQELLGKLETTVPYELLQLYSGLDGDQTLQFVAPDLPAEERKKVLEVLEERFKST